MQVFAKRFNFASKLGRYYFASPQMADWQYVAKIHKSLRQNNINEAIKYLVNSHLDGIILDRQTFNNIHHKMNQSKSALSYQQLAYKLYRESFTPHILTIQWMKLLLQSKDKKTLQLLKKDYQTLGLQVPKILLKKIQNQHFSQEAAPQNKINKQAQLEVKQMSKPKVVQLNQQKQKQGKNKNIQANTKTDKVNAQLKKIEKNQLPHVNLEMSNMNLQNFNLTKLQQIIELMNKNNWKIVIHNLQLQFDEEFDDEDINNQLEMNNQGQQDRDENFTPEDLIQALASARKIKVEKIEILQGDKEDPSLKK